jgi:hypothetical protein
MDTQMNTEQTNNQASEQHGEREREREREYFNLNKDKKAMPPPVFHMENWHYGLTPPGKEWRLLTCRRARKGILRHSPNPTELQSHRIGLEVAGARYTSKKGFFFTKKDA